MRHAETVKTNIQNTSRLLRNVFPGAQNAVCSRPPRALSKRGKPSWTYLHLIIWCPPWPMWPPKAFPGFAPVPGSPKKKDGPGTSREDARELHENQYTSTVAIAFQELARGNMLNFMHSTALLLIANHHLLNHRSRTSAQGAGSGF